MLFQVFLVIGAFSFFAYIWLLLIIEVISPNVIELWEAAATFLLFPILMFFAYATDQNWCGKSTEHNTHQLDLDLGQSKCIIINHNYKGE